MKMTEINNSQIIPQEAKDFFKNNSTWSLLKLLQYRERTESFTYEKDKEHMFYKSLLTMISDEQAQLCLLTILKLSIWDNTASNSWVQELEYVPVSGHIVTYWQPPSSQLDSFWRVREEFVFPRRSWIYYTLVAMTQ